MRDIRDWRSLAVLVVTILALGGVFGLTAQRASAQSLSESCPGAGNPLCRQTCVYISHRCACCTDWAFYYYPTGGGGGAPKPKT